MNNSHLDLEYLEPLIRLTNHLAQQQSNVLLQLFDGIDRLQSQRKYPDQPIELFNGSLLAYYHIHEQHTLNQQEHGHFHIFHCPNKQKDIAQHIVGLSMDHYGQPNAWFTVNQWVTNGICLDIDILVKCLKKTNNVKYNSILEQWLSSIILIYRDIIANLLLQSDQSITDLSGESDDKRKKILNDRNLYFINSCKIDLLNDISTSMSLRETKKHIIC